MYWMSALSPAVHMQMFLALFAWNFNCCDMYIFESWTCVNKIQLAGGIFIFIKRYLFYCERNNHKKCFFLVYFCIISFWRKECLKHYDYSRKHGESAPFITVYRYWFKRLKSGDCDVYDKKPPSLPKNLNVRNK